MGLDSFVVKDDELDGYAQEYAERLAAGPQQAIRLTKRVVYQSEEMPLRSSINFTSSKTGLVMELEDFKEGVQAVTEKRKAKFQ